MLFPRALLVVAATVLFASGWWVTPAVAQQRQGNDQGSGRLRADPRESLSDSVRRVERDRGGRVLGAERIPYDGRDVNRVKWMDDRGRVRVYMDDPRERGRLPRADHGPPRGRERDGDD